MNISFRRSGRPSHDPEPCPHPAPQPGPPEPSARPPRPSSGRPGLSTRPSGPPNQGDQEPQAGPSARRSTQATTQVTTQATTRRRPLRTVGVLLATAGLLASGCSQGNTAAEEAAIAALPASTPKELAGFYGQKLDWHACSAPGFECATMKAPLDYDRPGSGDIKLAVARKKATGPGKRIGSLLVNPGGPGGSAISYLQSYAALGYPAKVRARYDMVAVDPRGVAHSEPVNCLGGKQMDTYTQTDATPDDQRERDLLVAAYKSFDASCAQHSGKVLAHVSTVEAARDMDLLRAALGDRKLSYVGASYGTFLGATYAGLYPHRVGRLVLDGAMDPNLSAREMNLDQTAGFETAFESFAQDCARRSDCPLNNPESPRKPGDPDDPGGTDTGSDNSTSISTDRDDPDERARDRRDDAHPEPRTTAGGAPAEDAGRGSDSASGRKLTTPAEVGKHLKSFFDRLDRTPLDVKAAAPGSESSPSASPGSAGNHRPADTADRTAQQPRRAPTGPLTRAADRSLGEALATTGVIAAMYDEGAWPQLRDALTSAIKEQDGSGLLALSDSYYERADDGHYANLMSANAAVNCLDLPPAFTTPEQVRKAVPDFEKASPVFGEGLAWASLTCAYWPVHATGRPHRIKADGAAPIVVVGTVRDPATPYAWARSLASQLDSGHLLTYNGDGHTAYGRGSTCIDNAVNHYLLTGTPPKNGKRCSQPAGRPATRTRPPRPGQTPTPPATPPHPGPTSTNHSVRAQEPALRGPYGAPAKTV